MADDRRTTILSINIDNGAAIKRIADLSRAIDENKKHVKELRNSIKELDSSSDDYAEQLQSINEEIAATNAQTTEYKRTMGDLNRVVANSVRENMNNEGSLKGLRAELSRLTNAYDDMGRAQRESTEGKELLAQIDSITKEIKGQEEATGRFQRNVGSYEDAIRNVIGANSGWASSLLGLANGMDTANGIIPGLKGGIIGLNGAMKSMLANPVFLTLFGIAKAGEAVKFWFDYNKGLAEATRLTEQFTGLAGEELTNYRDEVQAVADTYGKDFKDVLQSTNSLAQQFGISYDEAINVIKDGFVAGADVSEQFLDTVKEYPAFFREAGLSASEFVAISTEATKAGVFGDKGVDAIKEATIRMREMTTATDEALAGIGLSGQEIQDAMANGTMTAFDAIQLVSEKISELPETSSEVGTAVADIFGGAGEDAGLQYLKTLKDISTDLDEVKNKAGEYARVQDEYLQSEIELQKATNQLFGGMGESFDDLITQGKTFLNNYLVAIINGVLKFGAEISAVFSAVLAYVREAMQSIKAMGDLLYNVITFNWSNVGDAWDKWLKEITEIPGKVSDAYSAAYDKAKKNIAEASQQQVGVQTSVSVMSTKKTTEVVDDKAIKEADKAREKAMQELQKYEDELRRIIDENTGTAIDQINAKYDKEIETLQNLYDANKQYADDITALEAQKDAAIVALNQKRNEEIKAANDKASEENVQRLKAEYEAMQNDEQLQRANKLLQMELDGASEIEILQEREAQIYAQRNALREEDFASYAEFENAKLQLDKDSADVRAQIIADEREAQEAVYSSVGSMLTAVGDLIIATSETEEEAAKRAKILALAEIAINTGVAIAEGVVAAMAVPFPLNLAAIISTVAAVTSNIAAAITQVKGAKFAEGGLVTGEGTATSDSIPAMLSNGESVMTAQATSMFAPVLSAFNQMGGGVPIPTSSGASSATGEELLARAFARGVANMPSPVVNVQEITKVANRVRVLENLSTA